MRGTFLSKSGKLITLAALATHRTTTVANICTHTRTFEEKQLHLSYKSMDTCVERKRLRNSLAQSQHISKKGTWEHEGGGRECR